MLHEACDGPVHILFSFTMRCTVCKHSFAELGNASSTRSWLLLWPVENGIQAWSGCQQMAHVHTLSDRHLKYMSQRDCHAARAPSAMERDVLKRAFWKVSWPECMLCVWHCQSAHHKCKVYHQAYRSRIFYVGVFCTCQKHSWSCMLVCLCMLVRSWFWLSRIHGWEGPPHVCTQPVRHANQCTPLAC